MNKKGHLIVSQFVIGDLEAKNRFWVKLGSIMPDLLFFTYVKGHTWDSSFESNCLAMEKLMDFGKDNFYSYFKLGYLLHYIEDYFTYPHQNKFPGQLYSHIIYEKRLTEKLETIKRNGDQYLIDKQMKTASIDILIMYLQVFHDDYLEQKMNIENDIYYMINVSKIFIACYSSVFEQRKEKGRFSFPKYIPQLQFTEGMLGVSNAEIEQAMNYIYANMESRMGDM